MATAGRVTPTDRHPVWDLYDNLRTARLNALYYECRLGTLLSWNWFCDMALATAAAAAAVVALWFWRDPIGAQAWRGLSIVAAVCALLKFSLDLTERIRTLESLRSRYRVLEHELRRMKHAVDISLQYGPVEQARLRHLLDAQRALVDDEPESQPVERVRRRCHAMVDDEFPVEAFYVPCSEPREPW